jgi:hypothetical protein
LGLVNIAELNIAELDIAESIGPINDLSHLIYHIRHPDPALAHIRPTHSYPQPPTDPPPDPQSIAPSIPKKFSICDLNPGWDCD